MDSDASDQSTASLNEAINETIELLNQSAMRDAELYSIIAATPQEAPNLGILAKRIQKRIEHMRALNFITSFEFAAMSELADAEYCLETGEQLIDRRISGEARTVAAKILRLRAIDASRSAIERDIYDFVRNNPTLPTGLELAVAAVKFYRIAMDVVYGVQTTAMSLNNFSAFEEYPQEPLPADKVPIMQPETEVQNRDYILLTAAQLNLSRSDYNIADMAQMTKPEINKFLMQVLKNKNKSSEEILVNSKDAITALFDWSMSQEAINLKNRISRAQSAHTASMQEAQNKLREAIEARLEYNAKTGDNTQGLKLFEQINKIVSGGFYKFTGVTGGGATVKKLNFETGDVLCSYRNATHGIDYGLHMGRYKIEYTPTNGRIRVYGLADNLKSHDYIHPHISSSNEVCWGNAGYIFNKLVHEQNIADVMNALQVILTTYNPESPYRELHEFVGDDTSRIVGVMSKYTRDGYILIESESFESCSKGVNIEYNGTEMQEDEEGYDREYMEVTVYKLVDARSGKRLDNKTYIRDEDGNFHDLEFFGFDWIDK